jgi:hypothetical protein
MATNKEIASTIIAQLGGQGRLSAMTGANSFVAIEKGLQFKIGKNAKNVNTVRIILTEQDLYNVEFGAARGMKYTVKYSTQGAYVDMLKPLFEAATGLYLTL